MEKTAAASFTHLLAEDTDTLLGHRERLLKGIRADLRATKYTWVLNSFRMNVGIKHQLYRCTGFYIDGLDFIT